MTGVIKSLGTSLRSRVSCENPFDTNSGAQEYKITKAAATRCVVIELISPYECHRTMTSSRELARIDTCYLSLRLAPTSRLYNIRGFTPTDSAITLYTHKLWHRRYFLIREVPYWLQSSITGSAFHGFILIIQKNSMLKHTKIFRSRMGAFRCIDTRYPSRVRNHIR